MSSVEALSLSDALRTPSGVLIPSVMFPVSKSISLTLIVVCLCFVGAALMGCGVA